MWCQALLGRADWAPRPALSFLASSACPAPRSGTQEAVRDITRQRWTQTRGLSGAVCLNALPLLLSPPQVKFLVPNVAAGSIIGKSGANITEIQTQSNARMQVNGLAVETPAVPIGGRRPLPSMLLHSLRPQESPTYHSLWLSSLLRSFPAPASSIPAAPRARTASCSSRAPSTSC